MAGLRRRDETMEPLEDSSQPYEADIRRQHLERPGFRINELKLSPMQKVPWHCHSNVRDTFYVIEGQLRIFLRDPEEEKQLGPSDSYRVEPRRPHLVTNDGDGPVTFLVLQGIGEYDYVPLT